MSGKNLIRVFYTGTTMAGCSETLRQLGLVARPAFDPSSSPYTNAGGWGIQWALGANTQAVCVRKRVRTSRAYDPITDADDDPRFRSEGDFIRACDGIVFVADSQAARREANVACVASLRELLAQLGRDVSAIPVVFQLNKRDLPDLDAISDLASVLSAPLCRHVPSVATTGRGVGEALDALLLLISSETARTPAP